MFNEEEAAQYAAWLDEVAADFERQQEEDERRAAVFAALAFSGEEVYA